MSDNSDHLTPTMRRAVEAGKAYTAIITEEQMSPMALRAALRKQRIDNLILQKKLDAANRKIAQYEASKALAAELARDEEGTCP